MSDQKVPQCRNRLSDPKRARSNTAGPICDRDADYTVPGPRDSADITHLCQGCLVDKILFAKFEIELAQHNVRKEEAVLEWLLGARKDKQQASTWNERIDELQSVLDKKEPG